MPPKKKKDLLNRLRQAEPTVSFLLGVLVVLVVGFLGGRYLYRYYQRHPLGHIGPRGQQVTPTPKQRAEQQPEQNYYVVQPGDYLWKIAEKYYHSGYQWVTIAQANKLSNPNVLYRGQKLIIPQIKTKSTTTISQRPTIPSQQTQYTVQKGDSLSLIALRAYGDMFAWPRLWQANKASIKNPWLIYPGQVIKIPRP